jgi:hypothetical protein
MCMSICSRSTFHTSAQIWKLLTAMDMTVNGHYVKNANFVNYDAMGEF